MLTRAPASQFILSSGTLYLSPPQPRAKASAMRDRLRSHVEQLGPFTLENAPVSVLVEALELSGIQSWFIQEEEGLKNWENASWSQRLLLSDVQDEVCIRSYKADKY